MTPSHPSPPPPPANHHLNSLIVEQHIGRKEVEAGDVGVAANVVVHAGQLSVGSKDLFFIRAGNDT